MAEHKQPRTAQQENWRQILERAYCVGAKIKARRENQPLTPPEEIMRQVREERGAKLADLLNE